MFEKTGHLEVPLDLIVASTYAQGSITLQDFVDLTSQLPRETPLYALVFDDDGVEYSRQIVSAAIRVERIGTAFRPRASSSKCKSVARLSSTGRACRTFTR